ncbi:hypothetical protein MUN81_14890 [Hymenobacter sp. 5317J-9]|uniref:hypothetical protein n=1 Tax=Hymenobacter sp. 5317J-9 TaxID=2932250 RepID=UPI001FD7106A|nr:hypothetical protein [Hymenobacter sp. 5317J-9]UOQ96523.1 hypothetical protein MUN81_14890 [Hymenobacter sp. 5317J-9]
MLSAKAYLPALYLNLVLVSLLVANLVLQEYQPVGLYLMVSWAFNPLGAVLMLCLGKWRATPWLGAWLFLSIGVAALAAPFQPPSHS